MNQSQPIDGSSDANAAVRQILDVQTAEGVQADPEEGGGGQNVNHEDHNVLLQMLSHQQRLNLSTHLGLGLAHQINHPLSASVNYIQCCVKMLQDDDFNRNELLSLMSRASEESYRVSELIRRLRRFVSQPEPRLLTMNFNYAVLEMVALLGPLLKEHQIDLQINLTEDLPQIVGDRIQLEQVVFNLVLNAIECFDGSSQSPATIDLMTEPGQGNRTVILHVKDNGPGWGEASLETLCEVFYTTKPDCLGLGLPMSQAICKAHGGCVNLLAQQTGGTCATVVLPVSQNDAFVKCHSACNASAP